MAYSDQNFFYFFRNKLKDKTFGQTFFLNIHHIQEIFSLEFYKA
jgi:hypothetical protein